MTEKQSIKDFVPRDGKALRIAFVGDSITEGVGSGDRINQSYPAQLGRMLGDKYVVGNFGKGGAYVLAADNPYNIKKGDLSYRNTQQYKDSLAFGADVVIIKLGINDIRSMSCEEAKEELYLGLVSLIEEYRALEGVQKVYVALSVRIANCNIILSMCDGPLQKIQRAAARACGVEVLDMHSYTREYLDVMLHHTNDITHPNAEQYTELARAIYALLMREEFTPTIPKKSQSGVVFVKTGGLADGLGENAECAIDSIAKAVGLLRDGGGTVVVCGPYSNTYETMLPKNNGNITITSVWDGVDYRESGAYFGLTRSVFFHGDFVIDDINIKAETKDTFLVFGYNNVKIGQGVVCSLGEDIGTYPLLLAGHSIMLGGVPAEQLALSGECDITVDGGTWAYIRGGNRQHTPKCAMASTSDDAVLNITINGGTFTNREFNLCSATGMNSFAGECVLSINGGKFLGDVYAISRANNGAVMSGSVTLNVTGGDFDGYIIKAQDNENVSINGSCSINIAPHLKEKAVGFDNVTLID